MKINSIKLRKFKPLYLSNITEIEYTMEQLLQVILGTNGCGKSWLLATLSPLPADVKMFDPTGYKIIDITFVDNYLLKSEFDEKGKGKHSFFNVTKDKELNPGGTLTVQKNLVEQEFKYTSFIHQVLTGRLSLTEMPFNARKDLIFKVSSVDLTYASDMFDMVAKEYRDTQGALKHITSKVEEIATKLITDEDLETLNLRCRNMESRMSSLTLISNPSAPDASYAFERMHTLKDHLGKNIDAYYNAVKKIKYDIKRKGYLNKGTMSELHKDMRAKADIKGSEANNLLESIGKFQSIAKRLENCPEGATADNLSIRITDLRKTLDAIPDDARVTHNDPGSLIITLPRIMSEMNELFLEDPTGIRVFSREEVNEVFAREASIAVHEVNLESYLKQAREILHHVELSILGDVNCEKCGHINLSEGSTGEAGKIKAQADIATLVKALTDNSKEHEEIMPLFDEVVKYERLVTRLSSLYRNYSVVTSLWTDCVPRDVLTKPQIYVSMLGKELTAQKNLAERDELIRQIKELEEYQELYNISRGMGTGSVVELELKYNLLNKEFEEFNDIANDVAGDLERMSKLEDHLTVIDGTVVKIAEFFMDWKDNMQWNYVADEMSDLQGRLASVRVHLNSASGIKGNLTMLQEDEMGLSRKRMVLKTLFDSLSPKTGIISKALRTVCEQFTTDVNEILSRVWNYEFLLLPYANPNNLDFKFPMVVAGNKVEDIKFGSAGQKDMINTAVNVCIMNYLGIKNYPMFLDEVGSTFDTSHRANFIEYVNDLITTGECSQLFMISHYAAQYGGLYNSDVVVLCNKNIVAPSGYNEHVTIT